MATRVRTILVLCLLVLPGAEKAPDTPKSVAARGARAKYDLAVADAKAAYDRAVLAAERTYLAELKSALDAAMTAKNLDEANRINAEIKRVQEAPARPPAVEAGGQENPYLGKWKGALVVTITPDGKISGGDLRGTWSIKDGKCHVRWDSGILEVLTMEEGGGAVKTEFGPPGGGTQRGRWTRVTE